MHSNMQCEAGFYSEKHLADFAIQRPSVHPTSTPVDTCKSSQPAELLKQANCFMPS